MPYEPTSNFNIGTKLEFKILYKWNIFFPFRIAPPPPPYATRKQERPPQKKKMREKAEISTTLWRNEKAQSTLNPTN
jgi:hypothetical protein